MSSVSDRDHFAAAALTGLLARGLLQSNLLATDSYKVADAMLREREQTNLDAAPAARAPEPEPEPAARRLPAGGTGDTVHGAAPAARASVGRPRTDNADLPTCAGTGDTPDSPQPIAKPTPVHTPPAHATPSVGSVPRDGTEPVAWAVMTADGTAALHTSCTKQGSIGWKRMMERQGEVVPLYRQAPDFAPPPPDNAAKAPDNAEPEAWAVLERDGFGIEGTFTDRDEAAEWCDNRQQIVPLYRQPPCQVFSQKNLTLTNAEREAIARSAAAWETDARMGLSDGGVAVTLRGLLERTR